MAEVHITLRDTPLGTVSVHTESVPPYQHPLSPAQLAALEIQLRTARQWGIAPKAAAATSTTPKETTQ